MIKTPCRHNIVVILCYSAIVLIATYPLVLDLTHSIYGIGHDNLGMIWDNWARLKMDEKGLGSDKFIYSNYPEGVDLSHKLIMYTADGLNFLSLKIIPNAIAAYNLVLLLKFIFAAYFMYILLGYVVRDNVIAFLGGLIFAFNPYFSVVSKAYGQTFVTFALPLAFLYLIKFLEYPSISKMLLFIFSYALFFGENYYFGYFGTVSLWVCFIIWICCRGCGKNQLLGIVRMCSDFAANIGMRDAILLIGGIAVLAGLSTIMYRNLEPHMASRAFSLSEAAARSARPWFYILPSVTNNIWGERVKEIVAKYLCGCEVFEETLYLGFVPLTLILGRVLFGNRNLAMRETRIFFSFLLLMLVSIAMAFGPYIPLQSFECGTYANIADSPHILGPSYLFFKLAPMFRFQCRHHVITIFSLVVCFSLSLKFWSEHYSGFKRILMLIIMTLVFIEYNDHSSKNILNLYEHMPEAYKYISKDKEVYSIVDMNDKDYPSAIHLNLYQVFHNKMRLQKLYENPEDILDLKLQEKYMELGCRYVVVVTSFKQVTYPPLQDQWDNPSIRNWPMQNVLGHLRLERKFSDSLLYSLTPQ